MRYRFETFLLAMLCALPAQASVLPYCARWLLTGAVAVSTMFLTPAHEDSALRPSREVRQPFASSKPWREFQISALGEQTEGISTRFFHKSALHRGVAQRVNGVAREEEADPRLREMLDGEVPYLSATLLGVAVWREDRSVRIGWVAPTQVAIFPQSPSLKSYDGGEWIELSGTFLRKGKLGEVRGELAVEVRYDSAMDRLQVRNARCRIEVKSIVSDLDDEATLPPAEGVHRAKNLPPPRWLDRKN